MSLYTEPMHWRERAKEARDQAAKMQDPEAKRGMLEVAKVYDRLAARYEAQTGSK